MEYPSLAEIDLDALGANLRTVRSGLDGQKVLAVVKADAYGHGRTPCARAALAAGADFLGVAQLAEALELRADLGPHPRILAWIYGPDADLAPAVAADIDITVSTFAALDAVALAARTTGRRARIQLKVDTAMSRGGFALEDLAEAATRARRLETEGLVRVVGLWSHLARADEPACGLTEIQVERFEQARAASARAGLDIELHHLAASGGTLWHPSTHYDMVRPGIVLYGLSPEPAIASAAELGLQAVMTLSAPVVLDRRVPAGTGVSYGHTAHAGSPARLGLIPLGYADGIARSASNSAPLSIAGARTRILGRVCMDQFVVELPEAAAVGDDAVLFGDAAAGVPTADEWGAACGTIGYEIVTRLGPRIERRYLGDGTGTPPARKDETKGSPA